ncbi:hypothetical protein [Acanthopleuribacter pedis]|uniref:Uncharacterized protein n=1 Tax=Acanthopleuribacter pedis TaxID=442870 RepID=A0A8J7QBJ9_9BACT|nr:hypothetical protein [Acanthopleuribacter pedis]MBO1320674.1 hypothetical protein [Acanthopleuribacter pedis]
MIETNVSEKVARSLAEFADYALAEAFRACLVPPRADEKIWEWDRKEEKYLVWIIAEFEGYGVAVAYTEKGFGEKGYPWGLVSHEDNSTGSSNHWYQTLEECVADSCYL